MLHRMRNGRRDRLNLFVGASLLVATPISFLLWSAYHAEFATTTSNAQACIASDGAFIDASSLPGFDLMVNQRFTEPPVKGLLDPSISYVRDFVSGGMVGFLVDVAVTGPDRSSEDARARALGYEIGRWPYVPLVGDVVAHSPGLLEVYESVTEYTSNQAALDWSEVLRAGKTGGGAKPVTIEGLPAPASAFTDVLGPDDGLHEHDEEIIMVNGKFVIRLNFQHGSSDISTSEIPRVTQAAIRALRRSCGDVFPTGGG